MTTALFIIAAFIVSCLVGVVILVWRAPYGIQTPQGFRQLDSSETPDDGRDLHGAGGGADFIHIGGKF